METMIDLARILLLILGMTSAKAMESNLCLKLYQAKQLGLETSTLLKVKSLLTTPATEKELADAQVTIEEQIVSLEQFFGPYLHEQRQALAAKMLADSFYPKYNFLYHRPKSPKGSPQKSFAVTFNSHSLNMEKSLAEAFESSRINAVDFVFFKALEQSKYKNAIELNPEYIHTLILDQQNLNAEGKKRKSQASVRILERTRQSITVIEQYANRIGYKIDNLLKLITNTSEKQGSFFEISRVSNSTSNKKVILALRYLIDQLLLKGDPNNVAVISVKEPQLVSYYEAWGFHFVDKMQGLDDDNSYIIMATNGKVFRSRINEKL